MTDIGATAQLDIGTIRDRDIITSLGQGTTHSENVTVSSVTTAISGGPYKVTLNAAVPSNVKIGDAFNDEAATPKKWLIVGVHGSDLIVRDAESNGTVPDDSGTTQATCERYYNGTTPISDWEADLDDTDLYSANDFARGECYNDAAFDVPASQTINGGGTVGLKHRTLTVPSSERHNGTAGSGARVVWPTNFRNWNFSIDGITIEWLEFDVAGTISSTATLNIQVDDVYLRNLIVHDMGGPGNALINIGIGDTATIENCIVYGAGTDCIVVNNTGTAYIYNCTVANPDTNRYGISFFDQTTVTIRNTVCFGATGTGADFQHSSPSNADIDYVASEDTSASGANSIDSITPANNFVNLTGGLEDFHIKTGSVLIDAGLDLWANDIFGSPYGPVDIDGRDRDLQNDVWDIGAHEFPASSSSSSSTTTSGVEEAVTSIYHHMQMIGMY